MIRCNIVDQYFDSSYKYKKYNEVTLTFIVRGIQNRNVDYFRYKLFGNNKNTFTFDHAPGSE